METPVSKSKLDIEDAALSWKDGIDSQKSSKVCKAYHPNAMFLGLFSAELRYTKSDIKDYFDGFLKFTDLKIHFLETYISFLGDTALHSGIYRYDYTEGDNRRSIVARYSMVWTFYENKWLIINHHSSVLPQNI